MLLYCGLHRHAILLRPCVISGTVISGYVYNNSWTLIGKGNPQWSQAFYHVEKAVVVKPGDWLVSERHNAGALWNE